jgi:hypothetical protein
VRQARSVVWLAIMVFAGVATADACPFCGAVGQPLASRRDAAFGVAVGEAAGRATLAANGVIEQPFVLHQRLAGDRAILPGEQVVAAVPAAVTGTAAVFLTENPRPLGLGVHRAIEADETRLGYMASAPAVDGAAAQRLRWFVRWLEHPDPVLAEDAFAEFGQAPFEAVREAADALPAERLQAWVADPGIVQQRRGFYGLALGLVAASRPQERDVCLRALYRSLEQPADDFRSGFDGILAGVLVAEGEAGLDRLIAMGLLEPSARPVEKRQMLSVLRFAWESLGQEIPPRRVSAATVRLLDSPVTAAEATVDLTRYRAWDAADRVAALWQELGGDDPLVRRAVAGYLSQCPSPEARLHADAIRSHDPELYEQALQASRLPLSR